MSGAATMNGEARKLPLWRDLLEQMLPAADYNVSWPIEKIEAALGKDRDHLTFSIDVSKIREQMLHLGFYLIERQNCVEIPDATENERYVRRYQRRAVLSVKRSAILARSTDRSKLSDAQAKRMDRMAEAAERKSFLLANYDRAFRAVKGLDK